MINAIALMQTKGLGANTKRVSASYPAALKNAGDHVRFAHINHSEAEILQQQAIRILTTPDERGRINVRAFNHTKWAWITAQREQVQKSLSFRLSFRRKMPPLVLALPPDALKGRDLCGIDLAGLTLRSTTSERLNLVGAKLQYAVLHEVDLHRSNLGEVDFFHAYMRGAKLSDARLNDAILDLADLRRADLHGANLVRTHFHKTDLSGADLRWANFTRDQLATAQTTGMRY